MKQVINIRLSKTRKFNGRVFNAECDKSGNIISRSVYELGSRVDKLAKQGCLYRVVNWYDNQYILYSHKK